MLAVRLVFGQQLVPVISAGIRSGVNWIRANDRSSACASVRTSRVLPRPGTPSSKHMPAAQQADQDTVDDILLPHDNFPDFRTHPRKVVFELNCRRLIHAAPSFLMRPRDFVNRRVRALAGQIKRIALRVGIPDPLAL